MSYESRLGQTQTTQTMTTRQVVYRQPYAYPHPMYYSPGVTFAARTDTGVPGQPYASQFNPADVEKEVYKELPSETKEETATTGTEPQKVVKLESGLEVPAYIIQRDIARRTAEIRKAEAVANIPPPKYHKIGMFATKQPAKASMYALVFGYIAGYLAYILTQ